MVGKLKKNVQNKVFFLNLDFYFSKTYVLVLEILYLYPFFHLVPYLLFFQSEIIFWNPFLLLNKANQYFKTSFYGGKSAQDLNIDISFLGESKKLWFNFSADKKVQLQWHPLQFTLCQIEFKNLIALQGKVNLAFIQSISKWLIHNFVVRFPTILYHQQGKVEIVFVSCYRKDWSNYKKAECFFPFTKGEDKKEKSSYFLLFLSLEISSHSQFCGRWDFVFWSGANGASTSTLKFKDQI